MYAFVQQEQIASCSAEDVRKVCMNVRLYIRIHVGMYHTYGCVLFSLQLQQSANCSTDERYV